MPAPSQCLRKRQGAWSERPRHPAGSAVRESGSWPAPRPSAVAKARGRGSLSRRCAQSASFGVRRRQIGPANLLARTAPPPRRAGRIERGGPESEPHLSRRRRWRTTEAIQQRATGLRRKQTPAETKLWTRLRRRQLGGMRFRSRHPIGRFIVDSCCIAQKLVIEIDGPSHPTDQQQEEARTAWLEEQGSECLGSQASSCIGNSTACWSRSRVSVTRSGRQVTDSAVAGVTCHSAQPRARQPDARGRQRTLARRFWLR